MAEGAGSSVMVWKEWRTEVSKFDYFVTGGTGALCAYIAQKGQFGILGMTPQTLELAALMVLVLSVAAGFKKMEAVQLLLQWNSRILDSNEKTLMFNRDLLASPAKERFSYDALGLLTRNQVEQLVKDGITAQTNDEAGSARDNHKHLIYSRLRSWSLAIGFMMLVAARVWAPYHGGGL